MFIFICLWGPWARLWTLKHVDPWHKLLIRISICDKTTWRHPPRTQKYVWAKKPLTLCAREHREEETEKTGVDYWTIPLRLQLHRAFRHPLISTVIKVSIFLPLRKGVPHIPLHIHIVLRKAQIFRYRLIYVGVSSALVGSYETLVFQNSSSFLKHTS